MANITANNDDQPWYKDLADPELGVVGGLSNAAFFGGFIGGLVLIVAIGGLIYHCKRKKELEEEVRKAEQEKARANNKVAPTGDLYEEMEDEIAKHEAQKKKLSKYLAFLLQKDGAGLAAANQRRAAAQRAAANKGWF